MISTNVRPTAPLPPAIATLTMMTTMMTIPFSGLIILMRDLPLYRVVSHNFRTGLA